jgi:polyhydroxybutyrate depolymerase
MRRRPRAGGLAAFLVATAMTASCGAGGDDSGRGVGATTTATVTPSVAPTTAAAPEPLGPGDHRLALRVGAQWRTFLLHTPPNWRRSQRLPLVVALHMMRTGGTGKVMRDLTGLDGNADQERFLVAYPDGLDGAWYEFGCCGSDSRVDVAFIAALVDHLTKRWRADPDRIYATGASNGAAMSYRLAAALPGVFAAIAPVSGGLGDQDASGVPKTPVSLVAFHGGQDSILSKMRDGVAAWRRHVGCPTPRSEPYGTSGTVTRGTARCRNGTDVVVYELAEMGHGWPGARADDPMAAPDTPISANDLIWRFFEQHPRRR